MQVEHEDRAFLARFAAGEFPKPEFRHAEHVRLAWILLAERPLLEALLGFRTLLKAFALQHGADGLYNETVTCFYMLLIREHMDRLPAGHGWTEFRAAHPDLFGYPKALLERYYPGEAAFSAEAKARFLMPHSAAPTV